MKLINGQFVHPVGEDGVNEVDRYFSQLQVSLTRKVHDDLVKDPSNYKSIYLLIWTDRCSWTILKRNISNRTTPAPIINLFIHSKIKAKWQKVILSSFLYDIWKSNVSKVTYRFRDPNPLDLKLARKNIYLTKDYFNENLWFWNENRRKIIFNWWKM